VVLLDIDPASGRTRIAGRGVADRLEAENVAFHERVRYAFLDLAAKDPRRYLVVDAADDPQAIAARVLDRLRPLLTEPVTAAEPPATNGHAVLPPSNGAHNGASWGIDDHANQNGGVVRPSAAEDAEAPR
jgi:dTMP kinase